MVVTCVAAVCSVISRGEETHDDGADVDNDSGASIEHAEDHEVGSEADVPVGHNLMRAMSTNGRKSSLGLG